MKCHDCNVEEGKMHHLGCDMEICPFCFGQLISCGCCYEKLNLLNYFKYTETEGLPKEIYENGLSEKQQIEWKQILEQKGRIEWIKIPYLCRLCEEKYPNMFSVSDVYWKSIVPKNLQKEILCIECFKKLIKIGDKK